MDVEPTTHDGCALVTSWGGYSEGGGTSGGTSGKPNAAVSAEGAQPSRVNQALIKREGAR